MTRIGRPRQYTRIPIASLNSILRTAARAESFVERIQEELDGFDVSQGSVEVTLFLTAHFAWGWAIAQEQTQTTRSGWEPGGGGGDARFHTQEDFLPVAQAEHVFPADIFRLKYLDMTPVFDQLFEKAVEASEYGAFF